MTTTNRAQLMNDLRLKLNDDTTFDSAFDMLVALRERKNAFEPLFGVMESITLVMTFSFMDLQWCAIPAEHRSAIREAMAGGESAYVAFCQSEIGKRLHTLLCDVVGNGTLGETLTTIQTIEETTLNRISDMALIAEANAGERHGLLSAAQIAVQATIVQCGRDRKLKKKAIQKVNNFLAILSPMVPDEHLKTLSPAVIQPLVHRATKNA